MEQNKNYRCEEEEKYREQLSNLLNAHERLSREIYGFRCMLKVMLSYGDPKIILDKSIISKLKNELENTTFKLDEEKIFINAPSLKEAICEYDVVKIMKFLKSLRNKVDLETLHEWNKDILREISWFEDAFLDFMDD